MAERSIADWIALIQAEYQEIPGLHLTKWQAQRLWGLDTVTCDTLLETLERAKFLRRTPRDGYVWTSMGGDSRVQSARV
jgi:hypothetical protein